MKSTSRMGSGKPITPGQISRRWYKSHICIPMFFSKQSFDRPSRAMQVHPKTNTASTQGGEISIQLEKDAEPVWSQPYNIHLQNRESIKKEVHGQCNNDIGALGKLSAEEIEEWEWPFPAFGIPKKHNDIQSVINFKKINIQLVWKQYPLATIDEMLRSIKGFQYASNIYLNMG